jgi:hypothetical protein
MYPPEEVDFEYGDQVPIAAWKTLEGSYGGNLVMANFASCFNKSGDRSESAEPIGAGSRRNMLKHTFMSQAMVLSSCCCFCADAAV